MNEIFEEIKKDMDEFFDHIDGILDRDPDEVDVITDHLDDPMSDDEGEYWEMSRRFTMEYRGWKLIGYRILEGLTLLWIFFVFLIMMILGNV